MVLCCYDMEFQPTKNLLILKVTYELSLIISLSILPILSVTYLVVDSFNFSIASVLGSNNLPVGAGGGKL